MRIPRTRGVVSGVALILLGAFGALMPFFADGSASLTGERLWLSVAPGAAAVAGGLVLLATAHRARAILGAWLGLLAGAWFAAGEEISGLDGGLLTTFEHLLRFDGLGVLVVAFAGVALGRLLVRSVRDAELAAEDEARADAVVVDRSRTTRETGRFDRTDTLTAADRVRQVADDRRRPLR